LSTNPHVSKATRTTTAWIRQISAARVVHLIVATFLALSSGCSKAQGEAIYAALSRKTSRVFGSAAVIVANCLTRAVSNLQGRRSATRGLRTRGSERLAFASGANHRLDTRLEGRLSTHCRPSFLLRRRRPIAPQPTFPSAGSNGEVGWTAVIPELLGPRYR
jgi:hypothetical protein